VLIRHIEEHTPVTVALAHQATPTGHLALTQAGREAVMRGTTLVVIHVVATIDLDNTEAFTGGITDEISNVVNEAGLANLDWRLELTTTKDDASLPEAVLAVVDRSDAELLVIGARRRSPVGKFLLGSATQTMILHANVPVLVVKS
jgi:nucleotide-binding universal stress UspA family protein